MDRCTLRAAVTFIWLATGLGVFHPEYRRIGRDYLDRLGLPECLMVTAFALDVVLALIVLLMPPKRWLTLGQVMLIGFYTVLLGWFEPALLVSPFGVLSKNVSLAALILTAHLIENEGW